MGPKKGPIAAVLVVDFVVMLAVACLGTVTLFTFRGAAPPILNRLGASNRKRRNPQTSTSEQLTSQTYKSCPIPP